MVGKKAKRRIVIVSVILAVLLIIIFVAAPFGASVYVYGQFFDTRYYTSETLAFSLEEFEGLKADRHEFISDKGQTLVGYRYYTDGEPPRGVVVIAHGFGGGGHNSYMDVAYFFACNGYDVFAFDATGNDESGGEGVGGLPQGVIDLSCAIDYVESLNEFNGLPVMLFGHSWGGYAVGAVLNYHPEVKAVAAFAGFNRSADLLRAQGVAMLGSVTNALMPYVNAYERCRFGGYASATAMDGFANSEAGIFIVHSDDDDVVPKSYGYDIYYSSYADNPRFRFVLISGKGHINVLYSDEYTAYVTDFNDKFFDYFGDRTPSEEERAEYITEHLDRSVICGGLNEELFGDIVGFFDSYI